MLDCCGSKSTIVVGIPVLVYRLFDPPTTPLLWIRWIESDHDKSYPTFLKHWTPLNEISPNLVRAVIAAEDQKFFSHSGFDWQAVEAAIKTNLSTDKTVGASTISMQTARNVFAHITLEKGERSELAELASNLL